MLIRSLVLGAIVALIAADSAQNANAQGAFTLSSSSFKDGERLPTKFAGTSKSNPNCVGENISPALSWANPPAGTKSYAFVVFDPDGRPPAGFVHWVAYGIAASVTGFAEGEVSKPSTKYVGGQSTMKLSTYFGACTPSGPPHHYIFTLMASDLEPNAFKEGLTREQLFKELDGHAKAATSLVGTFSKQ
jgi:Raf kinase inhibitor-like YbhB/YbcL family protein